MCYSTGICNYVACSSCELRLYVLVYLLLLQLLNLFLNVGLALWILVKLTTVLVLDYAWSTRLNYFLSTNLYLRGCWKTLLRLSMVVVHWVICYSFLRWMDSTLQLTWCLSRCWMITPGRLGKNLRVSLSWSILVTFIQLEIGGLLEALNSWFACLSFHDLLDAPWIWSLGLPLYFCL